MVADVLDSYPDAEWRWDAVLARLRATGHVAGTSMGKHGAERADTFVLDNWRVVLAWRVENGTILVKRAMF